MNSLGIMFHHFHDETKHITSQGSIDRNTFIKMIRYLNVNYSIINADVWCEKALNCKLESNQICLTFDDALACQYDIAYPVLNEFGIKAFWFVYTSMYKGAAGKIEAYRHFRFSCFDSVELFYESFFKTVILNQEKMDVDVQKEIEQFNPKSYLCEFSFYTDYDRLFRYFRDYVLGQEKYYFIMDSMLEMHGYDIDASKHLLWLTKEQLLELHRDNQLIGLHSHTHPTNLAAKTYAEQMEEYKVNKLVLEDITASKVFTVSYPCNSYNNDTDTIMKNLGIQIGFDASMQSEYGNNLHIPRKDHTYIIEEMNLSKGAGKT